jgi:methyl-accepting chemotaxis protein
MPLARLLRISAAVFGVIAVGLVASIVLATRATHDEQNAVARQAQLKQLGQQLSASSDFLTNEARAFAVTGERSHLDAYWREVEETRTRDRVVARLKALGVDAALLGLVEEAKKQSDGLVATEARSMRLMLDAGGTAQMPEAIAATRLSAADRALDTPAKRETARRIMFDTRYQAAKERIQAPMSRFQRDKNAQAAEKASSAKAATNRWMTILLVLAIIVPLAVGAVGWLFFKLVARPVRAYSQALRERDRSDLTFALDPAGAAEVAELAEAFNEQFTANQKVTERLLGELTGVIGEVTGTAATVSDASRQVATASAETGRAIDEIASAVGDVAQGAERQVRMTETTRESVQETAEAAESAQRVAREGSSSSERAAEAMAAVRESSSEVVEAIRSLAGKSDEIGGIVAAITGIAEQTNLLALNAAIEAARAGEQGRGFAVVAEEVRKLAEESQQAAASIGALIGEIQTETTRTVQVVEDGAQRSQEGAQIVDEARAAFAQIESAVGEVGSRIEKIAELAVEVAAVAEQSSASTEQVSASSEETSASTQQIAASAQELAQTSERLEELVAKIDLART